MHILTPENISYNMNELPEEVKNDLRYFVLDYSSPKDKDGVDFYAIPLFFLDQFPRPAADLRIGNFRIQMPLDWSVVISDINFGLLEIIELKHLNDREFSAFVMNPISSYMPSFLDISIENVFTDVTWSVPRLKYGHILAVPLSIGSNPLCAYFVKDINKISESLDITKVFS